MNAEGNQSFRIDNRVLNSRDVSRYEYISGNIRVMHKSKWHYAAHEEAYDIKEILDNEFKFRELALIGRKK